MFAPRKAAKRERGRSRGEAPPPPVNLLASPYTMIIIVAAGDQGFNITSGRNTHDNFSKHLCSL